MRLLLHICCSNCAVYPIKMLRAGGVQVRGLWYNPNIHPAQEYLRRLDSLRALEGIWGLDITYMGGYGLRDFLRAVGSRTEGAGRCRICYRMRLEEAAAAAKRFSCEAFTTTLLVSPFQKFDIINEEAGEVAALYGVSFYQADWRNGFRDGLRTSGELGLYRQKYCGCIFSEMERFLPSAAREMEKEGK